MYRGTNEERPWGLLRYSVGLGHPKLTERSPVLRNNQPDTNRVGITIKLIAQNLRLDEKSETGAK